MSERARGDAVIAVRVQPRARTDGIVGVIAEELRVRVTAPPVGGAANRAARRLVARWLGVPANDVTLLRGATGRRKLLRVRGVSPAALAGRLEAARDVIDKRRGGD